MPVDSGTLYGIYRGVVADSNDPLSKRRLRLQIPQVFGTTVTDWAWAAEGATFWSDSPPPIGHGVWVMFEGGDPSYPVWVAVFGDELSVSIDGGSA